MANQETVILAALGLTQDESNPEALKYAFEQLKTITKTLKDYEAKFLKPSLFNWADSAGTKDEKGSSSYTFDDGFGWKKEARKKVTVDDEKAIELMQSLGLMEYIDNEDFIPEEHMETAVQVIKALRPELVDVKKSVTHESLEQAFNNDQITDDELASLINVETTYALVQVKPAKPKKGAK